MLREALIHLSQSHAARAVVTFSSPTTNLRVVPPIRILSLSAMGSLVTFRPLRSVPFVDLRSRST